MIEKSMLILVVIASVTNSGFATFGPVEDNYSLKANINNSTDIIIGAVESISCVENKSANCTIEDSYGTFGVRKYKARVLPCISLKGDIVIKKENMNIVIRTIM